MPPALLSVPLSALTLALTLALALARTLILSLTSALALNLTLNLTRTRTRTRTLSPKQEMPYMLDLLLYLGKRLHAIPADGTPNLKP